MLLSKTEALILQIMSENGFREMYGLELLKHSNGGIKRGTIYTTLQRMEDKGFVVSRQEDKPDNVSGIPRRLYEITGTGQRALQAYELLGEDLITI
ncbi:MAG: PadR family transcriptional regulator [Acidobacteriota bacterium]|nr:PadR family transcriptional regulator [Acidobacteriota bacterium]